LLESVSSWGKVLSQLVEDGVCKGGALANVMGGEAFFKVGTVATAATAAG